MESRLRKCIKRLDEMNRSERAMELKRYTEVSLYKAVVHNWLENITRRLQRINFAENWNEKYKPVKSEITRFCEKDKNLKWLTQYHFGCFLFALLNGNFVDSKWKTLFDFNLDFSHPVGKSRTSTQIIKGVVHTYKSILLWYLLSGINVLDKCYIRHMHDMIHEMLNSTSQSKICGLAKKLDSICNHEERFAVKRENGEKLDFAAQGWSLFGRTAKIMEGTQFSKYLSIKLRYLERLPKFSAFCVGDHWMTFLGCEDSLMVFIDSKNSDKFRRLSKKNVAIKATAVFIKRGGNMEKDFSEIDASNEPDDSDVFFSKEFIEICNTATSYAEWEHLVAEKFFTEEDREFLRELAEKKRCYVVHDLKVLGNFSEAEKIRNFSIDEWSEWAEKEKKRIDALEDAAYKKLHKDNDYCWDADIFK